MSTALVGHSTLAQDMLGEVPFVAMHLVVSVSR